jgi:hypothetical protein
MINLVKIVKLLFIDDVRFDEEEIGIENIRELYSFIHQLLTINCYGLSL